ncbi:hypothetical protein LTR70_009335 [Exophiala xenobiotica]|uniref:NAD(P)-binding protein n=1 Tax=Lithohypha guttulata TaxID=1690604 RepID=A0ABR0K0B5_9EURO|nr:hypothetical protein LTR24_008345 [Lithohypha guttulata]KAK5310650.1 hypothetical protein LTR70_009335 [Exophiala xenobiotica]
METLPIKYETLKNKSIIITGGASGLGLATASVWAEHGAYVTLADLNKDDGEAAAADLTAKGYKVSFVQCDVTDWTSSVAAFKHAANFSPRKTLDIAALFAGAGGDPSNLVKQMEQENPEASHDKDPVEPSAKVVKINLDGVIKSAKLALYYFRVPAAADGPQVSGKKSLFLIASLAGYIDYDSTHYCVSKYGVRGLFRSLRNASKNPDSNFSVNLLAPGYTPTPMVLKYDAGEGSRQKFVDAIESSGLWCPVEAGVNAATLSVTNEEVNGRSFGTWPYGFVDLMEDLDHGYGGEKLREHAEKSNYRKAGVIV